MSSKVLRDVQRGTFSSFRRVGINRCLYTTESPNAASRRSPQLKKSAVPLPRQVADRDVQHGIQEENASNIPFNSPGGGGPGAGGSGSFGPITKFPLLDAALTTVVGLAIVFGGGIAYLAWYKKRVLDKIEDAFASGYDPALELVKHSAKKPVAEKPVFDQEDCGHHLRRKEQDWIDRIVHGEEPGHYFVLLGPKGVGKGTMLFDAMKACDAEGVSICEAHPDLEVFRLRLGKALNFEFNEDTQTGLFQRRDPREGGPSLDIERALSKLEKVALRSVRRTGRPLVLIINNIHFFNNDDNGNNVILQLQQRAESWAASGIMTLVFTTDDYWPCHVMRRTASRMRVLSIDDLERDKSLQAVRSLRLHQGKSISPNELESAVSIVGGRLAYLSKVAGARDMIDTAQQLQSVEKAWLLSQIGLIPDCDDDVMDEQKWSSCSWLLLREFVKVHEKQENEKMKRTKQSSDEFFELPVIPYWKCRQIMTRADFLEELDRLNIIAIDMHCNVRPDSMLILRAAQEVVQEEGFEELLQNVRNRIDEIESLHRTRELTFKDIDKGDKIKLSVEKGGGMVTQGRVV